MVDGISTEPLLIPDGTGSKLTNPDNKAIIAFNRLQISKLLGLRYMLYCLLSNDCFLTQRNKNQTDTTKSIQKLSPNLHQT